MKSYTKVTSLVIDIVRQICKSTYNVPVLLGDCQTEYIPSLSERQVLDRIVVRNSAAMQIPHQFVYDINSLKCMHFLKSHLYEVYLGFLSANQQYECCILVRYNASTHMWTLLPPERYNGAGHFRRCSAKSSDRRVVTLRQKS